MKSVLIPRHLGLQPYEIIWQQMQAFTDNRDKDTPDELWLLQHSPVYTQGQAGKPEHILNPGEIPIVQTDRGGQVTYHGPGQLMIYTLLNIERLGMGPRQLVQHLEKIIIALLADYAVTAETKCNAPGVYVNDAKICSIGLRIRKGFSYHGLALNLDMDLEPFTRINPCGYQGMAITQLKDFTPAVDWVAIESKIILYFIHQFDYRRL